MVSCTGPPQYGNSSSGQQHVVCFRNLSRFVGRMSDPLSGSDGKIYSVAGRTTVCKFNGRRTTGIYSAIRRKRYDHSRSSFEIRKPISQRGLNKPGSQPSGTLDPLYSAHACTAVCNCRLHLSSMTSSGRWTSSVTPSQGLVKHQRSAGSRQRVNFRQGAMDKELEVL